MQFNSQTIFLIVILIAVFALPYFTITKPQKKQQAQRKTMLDELKKGDDIMTVGGFTGVIDKVLSDSFIITMNPDNKLKLEIRKDSILKKIEDETAPAPADDEYDVIVDDTEADADQTENKEETNNKNEK